ncbi:MAG: hypothetical protein AAFQ11_04720 [Pseudomonadota bacterium]
MTVLLAFKLFTVPVLVALVSLAARRFGAVMGGLLMGLPWMTAPVLLFLAFEKGIAWFCDASVGATVAPVSVASFLFAYGWAAHLLRGRRFAPVFCLIVAIIAFAVSATVLGAQDWTPTTAATAAFVALISSRFLLPKPTHSEQVVPLPWWDIPVRMVTSGLMVLALNAVADVAGPRLSGIVASYPVILTSVVLFMHSLSGVDAVLGLLRGLSVSLLAFIVFFLVATVVAPAHGMAAAYVASVAAGLTASGSLIVISRALDRRHARKASVAVDHK